MQKSEKFEVIPVALVKLQSEIMPLELNAEAKITETRKYNYADLSEVWSKIKKPLKDNGFSLLQFPQLGEDKQSVSMETVMQHSSGEWFSSVLTLKAATANIKDIGQAITYARRYHIACILGLVAEVDNDGDTVTETTKKIEKKSETVNSEKDAQGSYEGFDTGILVPSDYWSGNVTYKARDSKLIGGSGFYPKKLSDGKFYIFGKIKDKQPVLPSSTVSSHVSTLIKYKEMYPVQFAGYVVKYAGSEKKPEELTKEQARDVIDDMAVWIADYKEMMGSESIDRSKTELFGGRE